MMHGETIETGANDGKYNTNGYSKLKVMSSSAGWYLGTTFNGDGYEEPGSRETDYLSKGTAEAVLKLWEIGNKLYKRK
jgi:hypothetical protein